MKLIDAKAKLDRVINLSRVEMYKPIQVAEILREMNQNSNLDPSKLETYRNISRELRNRITKQLIGKVSTSSMRFQDDLWNESAVPPSALRILEQANRKTSKVEEYIYQHVYAKNAHLIEIRKHLDDISSIRDIEKMFESFQSPGLRTSADRLYEVFVLSVLQTDLEESNYQLYVQGTESTLKGLGAKKLINATERQDNNLKLAKMGHTNAADAGLDIWSNFGVVISVKNYQLDSELFEKVLSDTPVGFLVIICETVTEDLLDRYIQISNGRSVMFITKSELLDDAKRILSDKLSSKRFSVRFLEYFDGEFPLTVTLENFMKKRNYRIALPEDNPWSQ
jgi:type II restriction enzyme